MGKGSDHRERRRYPRFSVDLPLEYQEAKDLNLRGGIVINLSQRGALMESIKSIPLDTRLHIAVLFPDGFELADIKIVATVAWKQPIFKEKWEGYQYGLSIIRVLDEDQWKRKLIFNGRISLKEMEIFNEVMRGFKTVKEDPANIREKPCL